MWIRHSIVCVTVWSQVCVFTTFHTKDLIIGVLPTVIYKLRYVLIIIIKLCFANL